MNNFASSVWTVMGSCLFMAVYIGAAVLFATGVGKVWRKVSERG